MVCHSSSCDPNTQTTINIASLFAGVTKSPQFKAEITGTAATAQLTDNMLTVTATANEGLATILLTVTDSEGSTYSRPLNIAISGKGSETAIRGITTADIVSYELYDLNGKPVNGKLVNGQIYLMRSTDRDGRQHTMKVIKK